MEFLLAFDEFLESEILETNKQPQTGANASGKEHGFLQTAPQRFRLHLDQLLDQDDEVFKRRLKILYNRMITASELVIPLPENERTKGFKQFLTYCITYLENTCPKYLDNDAPYPPLQRQQTLKVLKRDFEILYRRLKRNQTAPALTEVLLDYFTNFPGMNTKVLRRHITYMQKIIRGIGRFLDRYPRHQWSERLWHLMVYFNCNKEAVINLMINRVKEINRSDTPTQEKRKRLIILQDEINENEENRKWSYDPEHASLKELALAQISKELAWLDVHQAELADVVAHKKDQYLVIDLTVKQINLWAVINVHIGRIPYHNVPQTVRALLSMLRTKKGGEISYNSARKKMRDFDAATVVGYFAYLQQQMDALKELYGDFLK